MGWGHSGIIHKQSVFNKQRPGHICHYFSDWIFHWTLPADALAPGSVCYGSVCYLNSECLLPLLISHNWSHPMPSLHSNIWTLSHALDLNKWSSIMVRKPKFMNVYYPHEAFIIRFFKFIHKIYILSGLNNAGNLNDCQSYLQFNLS